MNFLRNFRLLNKALETSRIPIPAKVLLVAALAYGIFPIDIVPDFIPILGMMDDVIVIISLIAASVRSIVAKQAAREAVPSQNLGIDPRKIVR